MHQSPICFQVGLFFVRIFSLLNETMSTLSVRNIQASDAPLIANYWCSASPDALLTMGALKSMIPPAAYFGAAYFNTDKIAISRKTNVYSNKGNG